MAVEFIKNCVTRIPFRKQMDLCSIVAYEFPKEEVLKRTSFFCTCINETNKKNQFDLGNGGERKKACHISAKNVKNKFRATATDLS